jgi:hypothetical protein
MRAVRRRGHGAGAAPLPSFPHGQSVRPVPPCPRQRGAELLRGPLLAGRPEPCRTSGPQRPRNAVTCRTLDGYIPGRRKHDKLNRSRSGTKWHRLRGMSRLWRLVATPTTVCRVRAHRVLRQLAQPARVCACEVFRSPCHPQFRAGRRLVLELPNERIHGGTTPRTAAASSRRPARSWARRAGPRQLAGPPGGIVIPWR